MKRRGALVAAFILAGCSLCLAASGANLWLDVPFVAQSKEGCGDAAIAMVIEYWQQKLHAPGQTPDTADAVLRALPPGRHGVSAKAMVSYFEQHNYRAFAYAGDWDEIEREIAKGRPLIAALKPEGGDALHYVVIVGVDDPDEVVLLNDPAQRKLLKEARAQFEHEWKATGNWTLLAVPNVP